MVRSFSFANCQLPIAIKSISRRYRRFTQMVRSFSFANCQLPIVSSIHISSPTPTPFLHPIAFRLPLPTANCQLLLNPFPADIADLRRWFGLFPLPTANCQLLLNPFPADIADLRRWFGLFPLPTANCQLLLNPFPADHADLRRWSFHLPTANCQLLKLGL